MDSDTTTTSSNCTTLTVGESSSIPVVTFRSNSHSHVATLPVPLQMPRVKPKEYVQPKKLATEVALEYTRDTPRTTKLSRQHMFSYMPALPDTIDVTDMAHRDVFSLVEGCPEPTDPSRLLDQTLYFETARSLKQATAVNFGDSADKDAPCQNFLKRNLAYTRPLPSLKLVDNQQKVEKNPRKRSPPKLEAQAPSPVKAQQPNPLPCSPSAKKMKKHEVAAACDDVSDCPKLSPRDTSRLSNVSTTGVLLASVRIYSVQHNLLPSDYQVKLHFFIVVHNRKTGDFVKCCYLPGTEQILPINHHENYLISLDMPFDLTTTIVTPDNIVFLLVRASFFRDSPSSNNIRTRRGTTSRSMPTESGYRTRNQRRQLQENDYVMFGADEISVDSSSDSSMVLIETDKLGISPIFNRFMKDHTLISRIQAAAKKLHANPFIILSMNVSDRDSSCSASHCSSYSTSTVTERPSSRKLTLADVAKDDETPVYVQLYFLYVWSFDSAYEPNLAPQYPKITNSEAFLESEMAKKLEKIAKAYTAATKKDMPRCFNYKLSRDYKCVFCSMDFDHIVGLMGHLTRCHSRLDYRFVRYFNFEDDTVLPAIIMTPENLNLSEGDNDGPEFFLTKSRAYTNGFVNLDQHFISMDWKSVPFNMPLEEWVATPRRLKAYGKNPVGRSIMKAPTFLVQQMRRSLNDIVDIDYRERLFFLDWNTFCLEYGPLSGFETNPYRLCNAYVVMRREFIAKNYLHMAFISTLTHFVACNRISSMESYDITMRLQRNYHSCYDVVHPFTHQAVHLHESKIRKEVRKEKEKAKELEKEQHSNHSTVRLRPRLAIATSSSDDITSRSGTDTPITPPA